MCEGVIDDRAEIFTDPRVVGAKEAIWFTAAAPAIPGKGVPVAFLEGEGHAPNVFCGGLSFEPVTDDGKTPMSKARPVEVEEVAVRKFQALEFYFHRCDMAEESGVDGREMSSSQTERSAVGGGDKGHDSLCCFKRTGSGSGCRSR